MSKGKLAWLDTRLRSGLTAEGSWVQNEPGFRPPPLARAEAPNGCMLEVHGSATGFRWSMGPKGYRAEHYGEAPTLEKAKSGAADAYRRMGWTCAKGGG